MSVRVHMPPVLRVVCGGERWLAADGTTVTGLMRALAERNPALRLHLFDEAGAIRGNIVFLHKGDLVRSHEAGVRTLADGDELILTNALAGC
ncbi:MAG: MoaD/ThiS family protein [Alphaproteobacteria bacterium]|nr:MoaD/ThiS family protein [Alphaproteobacteria bacterium]